MEIISTLLIFFFIFAISQIVLKKMLIDSKDDTEQKVTQVQTIDNILNLNNFLKNSFFVEPIAKWQNKTIYNYIFNKGQLYEFKNSAANERFLIDDDNLCFNNLTYSRVNDPKEFLEKFMAKIQRKTEK